MATVEECEKALEELAKTIAGSGTDAKARSLDRSLTCRITDLDVIFAGRFRDGGLHDIHRTDSPKADIRLSASSDDLVALVDGRLKFLSAWSSGRIGLDASVFDLIRLKDLL